MEQKDMMLYKKYMVEDENFDGISTKPFTLLSDLISCSNKIDIVFRSSFHYVFVFKETEIVKQIKKRRVDKNSEIEE